jgi:hypothetical protein
LPAHPFAVPAHHGALGLFHPRAMIVRAVAHLMLGRCRVQDRWEETPAIHLRPLPL